MRRFTYTNILVVADVAARGIDIPVLANVVNYKAAGSSKKSSFIVWEEPLVLVIGWAYSIVRLPYLLDLELFLGKRY